MILALFCRHGVVQMRADADEAVRRFAAESFASPSFRDAAVLRGWPGRL